MSNYVLGQIGVLFIVVGAAYIGLALLWRGR